MIKGTADDVVVFPSPAMIASKVPAKLPGTLAQLDGERRITILNPLPPSNARLLHKARITAVIPKSKGVISDSESVIYDADTGMEYVRILTSCFLLGAKCDTPMGSLFSEPVTYPARSPDVIVEECIPVLQAHLYRLSGDYNPLHVDPSRSKELGFETPILHGLCTYGYCSRIVVDSFRNGDPATLSMIQARFVAAIQPGQTLQVSMWNDDSLNRVYFQAHAKETGKLVVSNAFVDFKSNPSKL